MKKVIAILALAASVAGILIFAAAKGENKKESGYLRIHVRANSNSEEDQRVKYEVKDEIVAYITPYIKECTSKQAALGIMKGQTEQIARVANAALKARGYNYGARASIKSEKFPTRVYGEVTLEEGVYDALIIELGSGKGDNWWCCIYPPLCFTSACGDISYRSAIADIINKFFKK